MTVVAAGTASQALGPAVRVTGLYAAYGRIEVLHGVDLSIPAGSVFALLGPNGAGKTTLLKVIGGRMQPTSGSVAFEGTTPERRTPESYARTGICSIPEGRGVFPNLSVRDNIRMWTYRGISRVDAEDAAYARFPRLAERRTQLAGTLSGGEQQMLAFSRILGGAQPRVLLFDEISMGLAPLIVEDLYELVGQIARTGVTVILVEQFANTALSVATRAAIMLHGKVHREGEPSDIADAALGAYLSDGT